ncbi:flagellar hook-basal body complex protein FliE [Plastoroseomonas arctica]|uniref:Flagellar hook-basal body complex protein FliE n=1 Tax=Plastoroseomonas arctica TaxID=1509237 RepID=A0AAF1K5L3_9PROT|nr:flagellar hook-basal body complex protein FliE [Plastoroseomonas arctica]MBR0656394.1 flagellar hook-basal body complex protein FliE [Plastoroseomonas arctica]
MAIPLVAAGVAAAYRRADGMAEAVAPIAANDGGFGAALTRAVQGTIEAGRASDRIASAGLTGQASVTDVVLALSRAELALQTVVAVRDRVVAAYQDVMRMPI